MKSCITRKLFIFFLLLSSLTNESFIINAHADVDNNRLIENKTSYNEDVCNFKISMSSNAKFNDISVQGLKNGMQAGDICKLNVLVNSKEYEKIKWDNNSSKGVVINKDGFVTAVSNGKLLICGDIYDDNNTSIGKIELTFYAKGNNITGWIKNDNTWYYIEPSTKSIKVGWLKYNNDTWYCLDENGAMKTGWVEDHGNKYYLKQDGSLAKGEWFKDENTWYYAEDKGELKTGWFKDHGNLYYLNEDGKMQTKDKEIDGVNYKFKENGECISTKNK